MPRCACAPARRPSAHAPACVSRPCPHACPRACCAPVGVRIACVGASVCACMCARPRARPRSTIRASLARARAYAHAPRWARGQRACAESDLPPRNCLANLRLGSAYTGTASRLALPTRVACTPQSSGACRRAVSAVRNAPGRPFSGPWRASVGRSGTDAPAGPPGAHRPGFLLQENHTCRPVGLLTRTPVGEIQGL